MAKATGPIRIDEPSILEVGVSCVPGARGAAVTCRGGRGVKRVVRDGTGNGRAVWHTVLLRDSWREGS